jgi:ribosomal protein L34
MGDPPDADPPDPYPPDDDTIRVRRTDSGGPAADQTAGTTQPAEAVRRRATYVGGDHDETADGSTIIARRESRRRATRDTSGSHRTAPVPAPALPETSRQGRTAAAPDAASYAVYPARAAEPVVAARAEGPFRVPQAPADGAAVEAARRRKGRRAALIVVFGAAAVAFAAAASLVAIALNP